MPHDLRRPDRVSNEFSKLGFVGFATSSAGPVLAAIMTNPFDVAKTRMQLDDELVKRGTRRHFASTYHCLLRTWRAEGIIGVQRGLGVSVLREGSKNFFRIGLFQPLLRTIHPDSEIPVPMWKRFLAGVTSGLVAALVTNPIEIVKTRLQAQGVAGKTGVGYQHHYHGVVHAFTSIRHKEGIGTLWQGTEISILRSMVATGVNLSFYSGLKDVLIRRKWARDTPITDAVCSGASAVCAVLVQHPVDLVRTRVYNQPFINGVGALYRHPLDAIQKIYVQEGLGGYYKGLVAHLCRTVPHYMLTFVFIGIMQRVTCDLEQRKLDKAWEATVRRSFKDLDLEGKGYVSLANIESRLVALGMSPDAAAQEAPRILWGDKENGVELADFHPVVHRLGTRIARLNEEG
mmetsp:Transcript_5620/g.13671  ORF Transcript_5620/g.13671 Transcript_5620/m.13671 type:complete len:402 (+) Transcript_5620:26-1231(+)